MYNQLEKFSAVLVFVSVFVLATAPSTASVVHRVSFEDNGAVVNSSLLIESEEPVGGTRFTVGQEKYMEVVEVNSETGEASYSYENGSLVLGVDTTLPKKEHSLEVVWKPVEGLEESFPGLYMIDMDLFGFKGKETAAVVKNPDILSWYEPVSFRSQYSNGSLKFEGEGNLWLRGYLSDEGKETENYYYFEDYNFSEAEELVPILEHVSGVSNPHKRIPVVVLEDEAYDEEFDGWSKGMYRTGGLVAVRESLEGSNRIAALLHETTHGFNSRALKWDSTDTAYYDEGRAKLVELLVSEALGSPRSEIFGEEVRFEKGNRRYRLSPRSSPEELWSYYQNDRDWISYWSPRKEEFSDVRRFGYALSELILRKKVEEDGLGSLREVQRNLSGVGRRVESPKEKAEIMGNLVDLRPCYTENRTEFESCLEGINSQEFDLGTMDLNHTFEDTREEIDIQERKIIKKPETGGQIDLILENVLLNLQRLIGGVSQWISKRL